jgi:hypothetical protein
MKLFNPFLDRRGHRVAMIIYRMKRYDPTDPLTSGNAPACDHGSRRSTFLMQPFVTQHNMRLNLRDDEGTGATLAPH